MSYGECGQKNDPHIPHTPNRAGITSICPRTVCCNLGAIDEVPSYINMYVCVYSIWLHVAVREIG